MLEDWPQFSVECPGTIFYSDRCYINKHELNYKACISVFSPAYLVFDPGQALNLCPS